MTIKTIYGFIASVVIVSGCATHQPLKPIIAYEPILLSEQTATIIGSNIPVKIYDDITAYVFAVDGQKVMAGRQSWNTPVTLASGQHAIQVLCQQGSYKYTNIVQLDAQAGAHYQVDFNFNHDDRYNCRFWIKDGQTTKSVTLLTEGVALSEYVNSKKMAPLDKPLEPRAEVSSPSYTVPITIINKMGN